MTADRMIKVATDPDHPSTWNLPAFNPTRVSIKNDDPGFINYSTARARREQVHVYLEDVYQHHCVTADSSEGWVKRCKLDASGKVYAEGNYIVEEVVHGKVEIRLVPDWKPAIEVEDPSK
jgi:hypothetical protein